MIISKLSMLMALFAAATIALAMPTTSAVATSTTLRVGSWNLRYDSQSNNITVAQTIASLPDPLLLPVGGYFSAPTQERPWSDRRIGVKETVLRSGVEVIGELLRFAERCSTLMVVGRIGFQEALVRQVNDMQELLGQEWGWVGVGRDDGKQAGEYSPVFYKK